jgi:hypothetical protein
VGVYVVRRQLFSSAERAWRPNGIWYDEQRHDFELVGSHSAGELHY